MNNTFIDKSTSNEFCPFFLDQGYKIVSKSFSIKQILKKLLFRYISGRPKKYKLGIPENPKCIAIATGGNLGGAVISIPLIKGIREKWPNSHLVIIGNRQHGIEIVKRAGLGDSFYVAPQITLFQMLMGNSEVRIFKNCLISHKIDLFVGNFDFNLDYLLPIKKIQCTVGQYRLDKPSPNMVFYDYLSGYNFFSENWLNGYWRLLNILDINKKDYPLIRVDKKNGDHLLEKITGTSSTSNDILIGVAADVWSGTPYKAFPKEKMFQICLKLIEEKNARIVLFGASGQEDLIKLFQQRNIYRTKNFIDLVGKISISQLPDVISSCSAIISNDSGLMHLSAATLTPVVAIYGMTDPSITWVYDNSSPHCIIQRDKVKPCYHMVDDVRVYCPSLHCINNISVDFVYENLLKILKKN